MYRSWNFFVSWDFYKFQCTTRVSDGLLALLVYWLMPLSYYWMAILILYINFVSRKHYFLCLSSYYLDFYKADTVYSESLPICELFNFFLCHGVENYFPGLWGMGTSNVIFCHMAGPVRPPRIAIVHYKNLIYSLNCNLFSWVFL